jgi:hypothetical protein
MPDGKVDITDMELHPDPGVRAKAEEMKALDREVRLRMSPPGTLNLPELLEKRRQEYGILDGAFARRAVYDRILLWQLDMVEDDKYSKDSLIIRPDTVRARHTEQAARGILVGAGLKALDVMVSNGIELGHIVTFVRHAPWRIECDDVLGHKYYTIVLHVGDIIASEDLETMFRLGKANIGSVVDANGVVEHFLSVADNGHAAMKPQEAYTPGGY